ncbi:GNAT family N-acetyltransferase [Planococcus sp. YIM B11945]|uniref:GNAT family N-acetyltransferase n=1 Tax=Planococcus sp. YIM B11945 TaxID=3435410 RepID=UPI003D7EBAD4
MIRTYQDGDAEAINALYQRVFGKTRSLVEWQWKFEQFSYGAPVIVVAELDGHLVGHAACLKIPARRQGQPVLLGERVDIMVDPAYQGRGIYKAIVSRMLEECQLQRIDVLYGFPAQKAKDVFIAVSKGADLGNVPRFLAINKPGALIASKLPALSILNKPVNAVYSLFQNLKSSYSVREIGSADLDVIDRLYERFSGQYPLHAVRGADYIKRRFLMHPSKDYQVCVIERSGDSAAFVVLHTEKQKGVAFTTVVDIWGANEEKALADMLRAVRAFASGDALNCWAIDGSFRYQALKQAGFRHINSPMPFVIKTLDDNIAAGSMSDWHVSQSDVDSY